MSQTTELKAYNNENLQEMRTLGCGSYGDVKLFYDKQLNRQVVGKFFQCTGQKQKIDHQFAAARREAQILARCEHTNIIRVLGSSAWDGSTFVIFFEHAPCGDLETLLHHQKETVLPWELRARFFIELGNALDYLHNHDPKRSYIHGDLKPQNVLLGDQLVIKVADFGAAAIAEVTGASSHVDFTGESSTQHTPYYTAPEFLKNPTKDKLPSMDVYSFGMIGYEIITRQVVFKDAAVTLDVLVTLIMSNGLKPNEKLIKEVKESLPENSIDSKIFDHLRAIVQACWKTLPEERPKVSTVKKHHQQNPPLSEIYRASVLVTSQPANNGQLKLQPNIYEMKPKTIWMPLLVVCFAILIWRLLISHDETTNISLVHQHPNFTNSAFLAVASLNLLIEYNVLANKLSFLTDYEKPNVAIHTKVAQVVKLNDKVYMFRQENFDNSGPLNLNISDASLAWTRLHWEDNYINRNYIAFNADSILAIGARDFKYKFSDEYSTFGTTAVDLYNTTTAKWTSLYDMNEARAYHSLVAFQGLICAIGGYEAINSECYNPNSNRWTYLPKMKTMRQGAAAVEFNDELYVIGGARCNDDDAHLRSVEKFNSVHALWTEVAPLNQPKITNHAAAVFNGKIYVIGGNPTLVEAYDPANDVWEITGSLNFESDPVFTVF